MRTLRRGQITPFVLIGLLLLSLFLFLFAVRPGVEVTVPPLEEELSPPEPEPEPPAPCSDTRLDSAVCGSRQCGVALDSCDTPRTCGSCASGWCRDGVCVTGCGALSSASYQGRLFDGATPSWVVRSLRVDGKPYLVVGHGSSVSLYSLEDPARPSLITTLSLSSSFRAASRFFLPSPLLSLDEYPFLFLYGSVGTKEQVIILEVKPAGLAIKQTYSFTDDYQSSDQKFFPRALFRVGNQVFLAAEFEKVRSSKDISFLPAGSYNIEEGVTNPGEYYRPLLLFNMTNDPLLAQHRAVAAFRILRSAMGLYDGRDAQPFAPRSRSDGMVVTSFTVDGLPRLLLGKHKSSSGHFHGVVTEYEFVLDVADPLRPRQLLMGDTPHCRGCRFVKVETLFDREWLLSAEDKFWLQFDNAHQGSSVLLAEGDRLVEWYALKDTYSMNKGSGSIPPTLDKSRVKPRSVLAFLESRSAAPWINITARVTTCVQNGSLAAGSTLTGGCGDYPMASFTTKPEEGLLYGEYTTNHFDAPLDFREGIVLSSSGVLAYEDEAGSGVSFFDPRNAAFQWSTSDLVDEMYWSLPRMSVGGHVYHRDFFQSGTLFPADKQTIYAYLAYDVPRWAHHHPSGPELRGDVVILKLERACPSP